MALWGHAADSPATRDFGILQHLHVNRFQITDRLLAAQVQEVWQLVPVHGGAADGLATC